LQEHNALFFGIYFREFFSNPLLDFNGHSICLATNSLSVGCVGILINWCMMVLQINNTTLLRDYHICNSSTTDESHLDYRFIHFCTALFSNEMMKSVSGFNKQLRNAVLCIFILSSTTAGHEVKMQKQN
jgi:hypothetical protein